MNIIEIFLGIVSALGGFVDIGELVFTVDAGAKFQLHLLWAVVAGTIGIIVFSNMSGKIAAVLKKPTFVLIREEFGRVWGGGILILASLLNVITCAAELGGAAIICQILFNTTHFRSMLFLVLVFLVILILLLPFKGIERVFGILGLGLLVFSYVAFVKSPDLHGIAAGLIPHGITGTTNDILNYYYFAVGIFISLMMPYETFFYSSGGIEDKWTEKDLPINKITVGIGFGLGCVLAMSLVAVGATIFSPAGISPELLTSSILAALSVVGKKGFFVLLIGIFFALTGAAVETALSGGYGIAQFFRLPWGKAKPIKEVKAFTALWISFFIAAFFIMLSAINPVTLVEYAVIFSAIILPFTYYPVLKLSADKKKLGRHANAPIVTGLGWAFFAIVVIVALTAVPLLAVTHMGK